jgi:predicted DNA-binding transcriptional regulator YafY
MTYSCLVLYDIIYLFGECEKLKINRLLEITILLLNRGTTTAKELAERFGVSTRTIYRDIEVLSSSGVPVYATQGVNGGISMLENYTINKTMLSDKESESILFALKAMQATNYPEMDRILDKLGMIFKNNSTDWIHIDFTPWGSSPNQYDKMTNIKDAILSSKIVEFDYLSASNIKSHRQLEPLRLIFKGQAWYLYGWSELRQDYRMFRLSRIKGVYVLDITFDRNKPRIPIKRQCKETQDFRPMVSLELKFTSKALSRLYDDYDDEIIIHNQDGTYTLKIDFPEDEWVYGYILSFGEYVEVINPPHIKQIIKDRSLKIHQKYL